MPWPPGATFLFQIHGGSLPAARRQLVPVQIWREPYFKSMTARMFFFDGTEVSGDQGVGLAYRAMDVREMELKYPVLTESPMITKNRSELEAFVNESRSQGDIAEIAAMSPATLPSPGGTAALPPGA